MDISMPVLMSYHLLYARIDAELSDRPRRLKSQIRRRDVQSLLLTIIILFVCKLHTRRNSRIFLYHIVSGDGVTRWRHHMLQKYIGTRIYILNASLPK